MRRLSAYVLAALGLLLSSTSSPAAPIRPSVPPRPLAASVPAPRPTRPGALPRPTRRAPRCGTATPKTCRCACGRRRTACPSTSSRPSKQTPDGYLWVASAGGLLRFDGLRFRLYDKDDLTDWTTPSLKTLQVMPSGRLVLVGLTGEVAVVENGRLRTLLSRRNGLPENARGTRSRQRGRGRGRNALGRAGQLCWPGSTRTALLPSSTLATAKCWAIQRSKGNSLFVVTDKRLLRYANGRAETVQQFSRPSDIFALAPSGVFYLTFTDGTVLRVGKNGRTANGAGSSRPGRSPRPAA